MENKKVQEKAVPTGKQEKKSIHRQFEGEVVSVREDKTIHVLVKTIKMHQKYKKQYTTSKKYAVHDEKNDAKLGDLVVFQECRPLSKTKRWRLVKIVK
jgi:small subunit ribosomal protein S17